MLVHDNPNDDLLFYANFDSLGDVQLGDLEQMFKIPQGSLTEEFYREIQDEYRVIFQNTLSHKFKVEC